MHLHPEDQPREQHTGCAQRQCQSAMREKAKTIRRKQRKKVKKKRNQQPIQKKSKRKANTELKLA
jgi:hypothetical protein